MHRSIRLVGYQETNPTPTEIIYLFTVSYRIVLDVKSNPEKSTCGLIEDYWERYQFLEEYNLNNYLKS